MVKGLLLASALAAGALAVPLEERQSCGSTWSQCGGVNWSGATCCTSGNTCVEQNAYYYQCLPNSQVTSTTTTTTTTKATTTGPATSSKPSTTTASSTSNPGGSTTPATSTGTSTNPSGTPATTTVSYSGNPFSGVQQWANAFYSSEIYTLAIPSLSGTQAAQASLVAEVPTFQWLDQAAKVDTQMAETLAQIRAANKAGANPPYAGLFVVYDLPDRDCAAAASNGEYTISNNGVQYYYEYIDSIKAQLTTYSDIRTILVIEPDSLANMVTNLNVAECAAAQDAYYQCINYALETLNLPNVAMYIDAGHAGWLGWSANLSPAAELFATVYKNASAPAALRGLATNVANYNAWTISSPPSYTSGDSNYDESLYVQALSPLLSSNGWSDAYFITDQSRSGKQPTGQTAWGDWCNAIGTGFGTRPTTNTGLNIEDAFVWVKPGGECDGTSNSSAPRYDYHCAYSDALQPAPQAGSWFQAYFVQLLTNANPAF